VARNSTGTGRLVRRAQLRNQVGHIDKQLHEYTSRSLPLSRLSINTLTDQGGRGVVVAGCPACRKRINTISQFLDHLTKDVMPPLIDLKPIEQQRRGDL
jgi:hypothetical protein